MSYLQLAHNEWDAAKGVSRRNVVYNFGRADQLDRAAIARLVASLSRVLSPGEQLSAAADGGDLTFTESRPLGGTHLLDGLWRRLGIDTAIRGALGGDPATAARTERVLFALVANRALAPSSKLAAAAWVGDDAVIDGLAAVDDDACYRAMDRLGGIEPVLAEQVYWNTVDLLNLEVDLLFFDTTSTYFETGAPDAPLPRDEHGNPITEQEAQARADDGRPVKETGFRAFGYSKDHREDLPQVIVGLAVTRGGIPVRVWSWPGDTGDSPLIRQVKDDLAHWNLGRVIWVADRGFTSAANRRHLQTGGGGYILGEKLRAPTAEVNEVLSRPGRYTTIAGNLRIKHVQLDGPGTERFVICHNPAEADRDRAVREALLTHLEDAIAGSDNLTPARRARLAAEIRTKPGLARYLKVTTTGRLRLDPHAIAAEARLDGKYLLRCSDPHLSAEDIALGYKQLLDVERGWRDMKQIIDLRPVYHRREDRIRAHIQLCWLALLLIRITETTTGQTWREIRRQLQRLHLGTFTGPAGTFQQTTTPTKPQQTIFNTLNIPLPPRIHHLTTHPPTPCQ